jgi:hypothetical protein
MLVWLAANSLQKDEGKFHPPIEAITLRLGFVDLNPSIVEMNSGSFGSTVTKS